MALLHPRVADHAAGASHLEARANVRFISYSSEFNTLIGSSPDGYDATTLDWNAFYNGGVYDPDVHGLYISASFDRDGHLPVIVAPLEDLSITETTFPNIVNPDGISSYYPPDSDHTSIPPLQVYCDQGDKNSPSQLVAVDVSANTSEVLLDNFNGKDFASIGDVRQHPETGDLWFIDSHEGYFQGFRPEPELPNRVYRFDPKTGDVEVVAEDFYRPQGIEFSPDLKTLYISDVPSGEEDSLATIEAFDVVDSKTLTGRRLFSTVQRGWIDGIRTTTTGAVIAAHGDGLAFWNAKGKLIGRISIGEQAINFAFAPRRIFIFAQKTLWFVFNTAVIGRETCKDFGTQC